MAPNCLAKPAIKTSPLFRDTTPDRFLSTRSAAVVSDQHFSLTAAVAQADSVSINISSLVNSDLTTYTGAGNYPQNGGALTVAGVPFTLATIDPISTRPSSSPPLTAAWRRATW